MFDQDNRKKLPTEGISIPNIYLTSFDTNPFSSGNHDSSVNTLKVRLCGLPLSVDESVVVELLDKLGANMKSIILYKKKNKTPGNKQIDERTLENIFMYIEPIENGQVFKSPCVNYFADIRCLLFHYGQPKINRN